MTWFSLIESLDTDKTRERSSSLSPISMLEDSNVQPSDQVRPDEIEEDMLDKIQEDENDIDQQAQKNKDDETEEEEEDQPKFEWEDKQKWKKTSKSFHLSLFCFLQLLSLYTFTCAICS